jgi:WD40 repeat protein
VSCGFDGVIRIWETETWGQILQLDYGSEVFSVDWAPNGEAIASGGADNRIRVWDFASGSQIKELVMNLSAFSLQFSPNGQYLAAGSYQDLKIWSTESWVMPVSLELKPERRTDLSWSPDSQILASAGLSAHLFSINSMSGQWLSIENSYNNSISWSPSGELLALGWGDNNSDTLFLQVRAWDEENNAIMHDSPSSIETLAWSHDMRYLATGLWNGQLNIYGVEK